jgi:hypothetical protein
MVRLVFFRRVRWFRQRTKSLRNILNKVTFHAGNFNYKSFDNSLTAFERVELDMTVKNMKLMISNTSYAKKLQ